MAVGAAAGLAGAGLLIPLVGRLRLSSAALYPVFALVAAAALYGATSIAHGSGFLAVFIAGLFLGDANLAALPTIKDFHSSLAGLAELAVFVALGLTINLTDISGRVLGRRSPARRRYSLRRPSARRRGHDSNRPVHSRQRLFITWSGLKGSVPILLAAFAVLATHQAQTTSTSWSSSLFSSPS
jgi:cell volume regulation protein A